MRRRTRSAVVLVAMILGAVAYAAVTVAVVLWLPLPPDS